MSRTTKIVFGIVGALVAICALVLVGAIVAVRVFGGTLMDNLVIQDPDKAAEAAGEIVDYDLPPGYTEQMVMNIVVGKMILIGPEDLSDHLMQPSIMLMQISSTATTSEMDQEQYREQMQASIERQANQNELSLELVDESEVEIAGQEVTLMTYEGEDEDGNQMRQVVSDFFEINDSMMMLMIIGGTEAWPESDIEAFIASIR